MIIQIGIAPVRIDVITSCAGIQFKSAWRNRVKAKYGDISVFFISLEFETQLLLASDLEYVRKETFAKIFDMAREVERMLKTLIDSLEKKPLKP